MMTSLAAGFEHLGINAAPVVANAQAKLARIIDDFHFDPPGQRVPEGIAERLAGNPVDFVPDQRWKISRFSFHLHRKLSAICAALAGRDAFARADRTRQVVCY